MAQDQLPGRSRDPEQQRNNEYLITRIEELRSKFRAAGDIADASGGATVDTEARDAINAVLDLLRDA